MADVFLGSVTNLLLGRKLEAAGALPHSMGFVLFLLLLIIFHKFLAFHTLNKQRQKVIECLQLGLIGCRTTCLRNSSLIHQFSCFFLLFCSLFLGSSYFVLHNEVTLHFIHDLAFGTCMTIFKLMCKLFC